MSKGRDLSKIIAGDGKIDSSEIATGAVTSSNIASDIVFSGDSITIPAGTTAQRPVTPTAGQMRYNTDTGLVEQYNAVGWQGIDSPPTVTGISGIINENTDSTITITGSNFKTGSIVSIIGDGVGGTPRNLTTTYVDQATLTINTNANTVNYVPGALFGVKVTNPSGLASTLDGIAYIDSDPIWSTAAGNLGTFDDVFASVNTSVSATDPDGTTITYSVESGTLPTGLTLNANDGQIIGTPSLVTSATTFPFELGANSNGQTVNRSFNIIINTSKDGTSASRAATDGISIKTLTGTTTDGEYWVMHNGSPMLVYCDMNFDGGGWMMITKNTSNTWGWNVWGSTSDVEYASNNSDFYSNMRRNRSHSKVMMKWDGNQVSYNGSSSNLQGVTNGNYTLATGTMLPQTTYTQIGTYNSNYCYVRKGAPGHRGYVFSNYDSNSNNQGGFMEWTGPYANTGVFWISNAQPVSFAEIYIK